MNGVMIKCLLSGFCKACFPLCIDYIDHNLHCQTFIHTQEQQSMKGADPQPEYYIDKIVQLTAVSYIHMHMLLSLVNMWKFVAKRQKWVDAKSVLD